jgi:hypothetical protein
VYGNDSDEEEHLPTFSGRTSGLSLIARYLSVEIASRVPLLLICKTTWAICPHSLTFEK